jgi:hypothetical protein
MGKLVRLSNYRRERQRPPRPAHAGHPYYYCTLCESEKFTLGPDGEVQCAGCGALMRNLAVRDERP